MTQCQSVCFSLLAVSSKDALHGLLSNGSDRISDVIDAYEHALLGCFPRARYLIGWDAVYMYMPIQYLPEWLSDWIYELADKNRPLPASVRK